MTLSEYNRQELGKQAKDLGFIRDTFEKVFRLTETMSFFEKDPVLSKALALKGGTAINLTIFNLPRLSVDIDLDYTQNTSRDAMMREREIITDSIKKYMAASSYILSEKSKYSHSLDSFVFAYNNAAGMKDNIKIEINYSLRCHVLPLEHRSIETLGVFRNTTILSVAPIEIYASKIVALLQELPHGICMTLIICFILISLMTRRKICYGNVLCFIALSLVRAYQKHLILTALIALLSIKFGQTYIPSYERKKNLNWRRYKHRSSPI